MQTIPFSQAENQETLDCVSWKTFNPLLKDLSNKRSQRLAYSQKTVEIIAPLGKYEHNNRFILSNQK